MREAVYDPSGQEVAIEGPIKATPYARAADVTSLPHKPVYIRGWSFVVRVPEGTPAPEWLGHAGLVAWGVNLWRAVFCGTQFRGSGSGEDGRRVYDVTLRSDGPPLVVPAAPLDAPFLAWEAELLADRGTAAPYSDWLEERGLAERAAEVRRLLSA